MQEQPGVITMAMYAKIRRMFYREHLTISDIQRRTSLSRNTIKK
jgi:DNA-binding transcriptional regulator LsrR (DeoR family)